MRAKYALGGEICNIRPIRYLENGTRQDTGTMKCEEEVVCSLSNGDSADDLVCPNYQNHLFLTGEAKNLKFNV